MEINGVANIKIIVDDAEERGLIHPQKAADIYKQLNLLERYMLAYMDATEPSAAIQHGTTLRKILKGIQQEQKEQLFINTWRINENQSKRSCSCIWNERRIDKT